jgi:hypothetical protein
VSESRRRGEMGAREAHKGGTAKRIFGTMAPAGGRAYLRARDLPQLIALWSYELDDQSREGTHRILAKLRRALRAGAGWPAIGAMT